MVFLMELKSDSVSRLGNNGTGLEGKNTGATHNDTVIRTSGGRRRIRNGGGSGRRGGGRWGCGNRGAAGAHRIRFESIEFGACVHGENHSLLTMTCLAAIYPDRISITDGKLGSGEGSIGVGSGNWHTIGFVSLMIHVSVKRGTDNPESKPPAERRQGLSKVDWVAVWFFCWKVKKIVSPGCAFYERDFSYCCAEKKDKLRTTVCGVNTRPAEPPTVTLNWAAVTWTTAVARRVESLKRLEKNMSSRLGGRRKRA